MTSEDDRVKAARRMLAATEIGNEVALRQIYAENAVQGGILTD